MRMKLKINSRLGGCSTTVVLSSFIMLIKGGGGSKQDDQRGADWEAAQTRIYI